MKLQYNENAEYMERFLRDYIELISSSRAVSLLTSPCGCTGIRKEPRGFPM
ncbi:hypothetical protein [Roseburia sp. AM59-24XD]|uniref:hypothetical protein n=1 Tax=Roseburia sp. AM59-24XD TaxID=2293138 RepID=UPI0013147B55|nr:hypothetical protein [Roseburia sp. AM59-24XD]